MEEEKIAVLDIPYSVMRTLLSSMLLSAPSTFLDTRLKKNPPYAHASAHFIGSNCSYQNRERTLSIQSPKFLPMPSILTSLRLLGPRGREKGRVSAPLEWASPRQFSNEFSNDHFWLGIPLLHSPKMGTFFLRKRDPLRLTKGFFFPSRLSQPRSLLSVQRFCCLLSYPRTTSLRRFGAEGGKGWAS